MITEVSDARVALERAIRQIGAGPMTDAESGSIARDLKSIRKLLERNEIATQGLVLSDKEYEVVANLLAASAQHVRGKQPEVFKVLQRVLGRLSQAQQKGAGVRADQLEIYQKRIHDAFAEHDETKLKLAVEDLVASTLRTDADPGLKVARYLMQLVSEVLAAQARHGFMTLTKLDEQLDQAVTDWNENKDWPAAPEAVQWVVDLVKAGRDDLELGQEAWASDEVENDSEG